MKIVGRFAGKLSLFLLAAAPLAAQHWQIQFFYDKAKSSLVISDLQFPSPARGVAVGTIVEEKRREPVSLVTSDGGAHWTQIALREEPVSLFFLNENIGWMVTAKGSLWQTLEAGKSWVKLRKPPGDIYRVSFLDEKNGWAVGARKTVLATHDGGLHWEKVAVASENPGAAQYSAYTTVDFATPKYGMITGWNIPPRRFMPERPEWLDPEGSLRIHENPHLTYSLITIDGGKTWKPSSASLFGTLDRVRLRANGSGLGLLIFGDSFPFPSEIYAIDWSVNTNRSVYRNEKFAVSDIWLSEDGTAYLTGNLVRGRVRHVIPGKVQVLTSTDLKNWKPMDVDYRAEANRTILAAGDDRNIWLATDTGMILKLVP